MLGDETIDDLENVDGVHSLREFCARRKKGFTVAVEGNIGCGKSTLLSYFQNCSAVESLKEPVEQWTNLEGHNLLKLLYEDSKRWSFTFNNYALLTRLQMHQHKAKCHVKMLERSLYSTRYVFIEKNHTSGNLTNVEYTVLSEMFNQFIKYHHYNVDLFVYLRAPPEVCYERLKKRNRQEEAGVPMDFLQDLHQLHEDWLVNQTHYNVPGPVLVLDASQELPKMQQLYEEYREEILGGCR